MHTQCRIILESVTCLSYIYVCMCVCVCVCVCVQHVSLLMKDACMCMLMWIGTQGLTTSSATVPFSIVTKYSNFNPNTGNTNPFQDDIYEEAAAGSAGPSLAPHQLLFTFASIGVMLLAQILFL